ncbi:MULTISPECIES: hypothetical protein [Sporomusa]|uniref:hypothetical protein n=1 Tax=Sporomusa TaxID=2375 RepID=UPI00202F2207|nr:hypothetical protein [Sporomusa sphaeroides]MCM0757740.1 hypothetical protein [Sporomusa sphaeroides DSM 2875]
MEYNHIEQSRIPACTLDEQLFTKLWGIFSQDGEFLWHATIGENDDLLGKQELEERPVQAIESWEQLIAVARKMPRIDQLTLTVEVPEKGTIAIALKNFVPCSGKLIVTGAEEQWVNDRFDDCMALFTARKKTFNTLLYTRLGFDVVQTVIPLGSMFVIVLLAAVFFIPIEIRISEWYWWITGATIIITLRSAYSVSNWLIVYFMNKYPYIKWQGR